VARLFICYAREDQSYAFAIRQWLIGEQHWRAEDIFVDVDRDHNMPVGIEWKRTLLEQAEAAEVMLFLASEHSLKPESFCRQELKHARGQILVVTIGGIQFDDPRLLEVIPDRARSRQITALDREPTRPFPFVSPFNNTNSSAQLNAREVENIGQILRDLGVAPNSFSWTPTAAGPYPGLRPLKEGDEALFWGRRIEIRDALADLERLRESIINRGFLIQAPSGAGKSSLLRAGLWPRLRPHAGFTPLGIVRAAKGIVHNEEWGLITALHDRRTNRLKLSRTEIKDCVHDDLAGLLAKIADEDRAESGRRILLLGIDQAEEITALSPDEASEFDNLLDRLLALPKDIDLRLVLTARDDSVDATLERLLARANLPREAVKIWRLGRLPDVRFRDIITGPAKAANHAGWPIIIDEDLVDRLVVAARNSASEIGDPLPILALALQRMVAGHRTPDGRITLKHEETQSFIEKAAEEAVAEAVKKANAKPEELPRLVIPRLASWNPTAGSEGTAKCQVASAEDLFAEPRAGLRVLAAALVDEHLLTCSGSDRGKVYEIAHEALLRVPPLGPLIYERRRSFELAHALEREAREWDKAARPESLLDREGKRLGEAKKLLADEVFGHDLGRQSIVAEYIAACTKKGSVPPVIDLPIEPKQLLLFVAVLLGGGAGLLSLLSLDKDTWEWLPKWPLVFLGICWLFWALDIVAGRQFREIISRTKDIDIANLTLAFFDLLYTLPLLLTPAWRDRRQKLVSADWTPFQAWWALVSSAAMAIGITYVLTYYVFLDPKSWSSAKGVDPTFWSGILVNIISDYLAVLVIRRWLTDGANPRADGVNSQTDNDNRATPQKALFFALFAGLLLVVSFTGLRLAFFITVIEFLNLYFPSGTGLCFPFDVADFCATANQGVAGTPVYLGIWHNTAVQRMWPHLAELHLPGVLAASVVHVWLPAFALSAYGLKLLNAGRKLSFVDAHPVLTLGVIASVLGVGLWLLVDGLRDLLPWLLHLLSD
jgi:hypothetical protein